MAVERFGLTRGLRGVALALFAGAAAAFGANEYTGANTMLPQINQWEEVFEEGRGRAYGIEVSLEYKTEKLQTAAGAASARRGAAKEKRAMTRMREMSL